MALPTHGRVIINTTAGELDIELWSRETPRACRNFLALAMEGYYDGVIFHRIVPGFLVQTGDRTGTGAGGESFYGEPFEDEIHPRLRFAHRGLVGMANNGTKNTNDSQFFITLDAMKIGEMEIDADGRPVYPPKIKSIRIMDNPFDDIIPRITAAEKRAQQRAREQAQREREEEERRKGAKKNVKLLSFGADEEEEDAVTVKKAIVRPDLVAVSQPVIPDFVTSQFPRSEATTAVGSRKSDKELKKQRKDEDITKIREQHAQEQAIERDSQKAEIEKMEAEIRKLARRRDGEASDDDLPHKKKKSKSYLEEELAKYSKGRGLNKKGKDGKRKDEGDVLAALNSFRDKLKSSTLNALEEGVAGEGNEEVNAAEKPPGVEDPGIEVDDDQDFMGHALHFPKDDGEETVKAERDYEVIDPRQRGARAKEEERERRRAMKAKGGSAQRYRRQH